MSTTPSVGSSNALDKNAFLQLMVTQMKYQDPLSPQDNTQFLAQLAQFTGLEQMTNVANTETSVEQSILTLQTLTQLSFEHQLIGASVSVTGSDGTPVTGQVTSVKLDNGDATLTINGQSYPLSSITGMG